MEERGVQITRICVGSSLSDRRLYQGLSCESGRAHDQTRALPAPSHVMRRASLAFQAIGRAGLGGNPIPAQGLCRNASCTMADVIGVVDVIRWDA